MTPYGLVGHPWPFVRVRRVLAAATLLLAVASGGAGAQTTVLSEGFEEWPPSGWTVAGACGAWARPSLAEIPNYTGGDGDAAVADGSSCGAGVDTALTSPEFAIPAAATSAGLTFAHDFFAASDGADVATVEVSVGGGSWSVVDTITDGPLRGPLRRAVDLSMYAGRGSLRLRFRFGTREPEGPVSHWWWQVDRVEIRYAACPSAPAPVVQGGGAACAPPGATLDAGAWEAYRWRKDGADLAGATGRTLTALQSGEYAVRVTDDRGCEGTSSPVTVTAAPAPGVPRIEGPALSCSDAHVELAALGGPYASYRWYADGRPIPGATDSKLHATASAWYTVEGTTDDGCAAVSSGHELTVEPVGPEVSGPAHGCGLVRLTTGSFASYQWLAGGVPIPGATGSTYDAASDGDYAVEIATTGGCMATSGALRVTVTPYPTIEGDLPNACPRTDVLLAAGGPYAGYQWLRDDRPIAGAVTATLVARLPGSYSVAATDESGCTVASPYRDVAMVFCADSEVSPVGAEHPLRLERLAPKGESSASGYGLSFQPVGGATGYNVYEGNLGEWYSHGGSPGNLCDAAVTALQDGSLAVVITPSAGDHYYLVTARGDAGEGRSGFDSSGAPIDPAQSTCAP
jgi:hypothetical protein